MQCDPAPYWWPEKVEFGILGLEDTLSYFKEFLNIGFHLNEKKKQKKRKSQPSNENLSIDNQ